MLRVLCAARAVCAGVCCVHAHTTTTNNTNHHPTQIALAQQTSGGSAFGTPVVVLADRDRVEMDDEVREGVCGVCV